MHCSLTGVFSPCFLFGIVGRDIQALLIPIEHSYLSLDGDRQKSREQTRLGEIKRHCG